jgi:hypothetical protein
MPDEPNVTEIYIRYYERNLSPKDYLLFPELKQNLRGHRFRLSLSGYCSGTMADNEDMD